MTEVAFALVDVFTVRPLGGNPVAVIPDADGLPVETMRAVARELAQSETVFLHRPTLPGVLWRLRSFTTAGVEVGGVGHHTLGAWAWLDSVGRAGAGSATHAVQEIDGALLAVEVVRAADAPVRVVQDQGLLQTLATVRPSADLARALGLGLADLAGPAHVLLTGVAHLHVALTDRHSVDAAAPDPAALEPLLARVGAEGCYLYTTAGDVTTTRGQDGASDHPADAYARFTNPTVGIVEDAATGTAAGPLAAALQAWGTTPRDRPVHILQGQRMGRPSVLRVDVEPDRVRLSGSAVVSGSGTLRVG